MKYVNDSFLDTIMGSFYLALVLKEEGKTKDAIEAFRIASELPTTVASDPRTRERALHMARELEEE